MTQRSLITGAAGLVGFHTLIELLASDEQQEIHCTLHSESSKEEFAQRLNSLSTDTSRVVMHTVDLEDFEAVSALISQIEPSVVYHTAAKVSLDERDGQAMVRRNVDMTHFVVEALLELKGGPESEIDPLLIHVSSVAALGGAIDHRGTIDERTPFVDIANASPYGRSKFLSQNDVVRASKLGLKVVIVNPSVIIGLNGKEGGKMRILFDLVRRGMPFYTSGEMGYVDVRDVVRAMVALASEPQNCGESYVLNGATLTFREFITIFGSPFTRCAPKIRVPNWVVSMLEQGMWAWYKVFSNRSSPIPRGYLTLKNRYDGSKIERALPHFRYRAIEETARDIARKLEGASEN